MTGIHNPHDKFYKAIFSRPEVAKDFVFRYLPPEITNLLDPDSITLTKDSFIDHALAEQFSDLLYMVNFKSGESAYLYLLFEHKSYPDPLVAFQLLRYMVRIWEKDIDNYPKQPLLIIIPMVFYHGKDEWNISRHFLSIFPPSELFKPFIPDFEYFLYDTHNCNDEDIGGEWLLQVAIFSMKYIFREEFPVKMKQILELIRDKGKESIPEILEIVVKYFTSASDRVSYDDVVLEIKNTFRKGYENIMPTIAEQFINQGKEIGREEGRQIQGKIDAILEILETRFSFVPSILKTQLERMDNPCVLKFLLKSTVTIGSVDEFLDLMDQIK